MTTVPLYEIANMRAILDGWLEESEGELTPEIEQLLAELEGQANEKIERIALFIREQLATAEMIEAAVIRAAGERVARHRRVADSLKAYLKREMLRLGKTKVEGLIVTVALQRNSTPAITSAENPEHLYQRPETQPFILREERVEFSFNRSAILAAVGANQPIPEAISVVTGSHIRIR